MKACEDATAYGMVSLYNKGLFIKNSSSALLKSPNSQQNLVKERKLATQNLVIGRTTPKVPGSLSAT
jgi:hypothetical protein